MAQNDGVNVAPNKKKGGILIAIGCIIIVLLVVVVVLLLRKPEPEATVQAEKPEIRGTVVTQDNVEAVVDEMVQEELVAPGYFTVSMTNVWHFANGSAVSPDADVENLKENTNDVYFDVVLAEDEDTVILSSPVIPRGVEWEEISLDTPLEKGTYDCVMIYHLIDEEQNTVSTLRVGLTIVVES